MSDKYEFIDAGYATVATDTAAAPTVTRMCEWLQISKSGVLRMEVTAGKCYREAAGNAENQDPGAL